MILCGWCGHSTPNVDRCSHCGHEDPTRPYVQRGSRIPGAEAAKHKRLADAEAAIRAAGEEPTVERIAERLDVSPRTVRRWREMSAPRPSVPPPTDRG